MNMMNFPDRDDARRADTRAADRAAVRVAIWQTAIMAVVVVGGVLLLDAAGVKMAVVDEVAWSAAAASDGSARRPEPITQDDGPIRCRIVPDAPCTCSAAAGGAAMSLPELLSRPAGSGVDAPALARMHAEWRRACGVTTERDTAP